MRHNSTKQTSVFATIVLSEAISLILAVALTALVATLIISERMEWLSMGYAATAIQIVSAFVNSCFVGKTNSKLVGGISIAAFPILLVTIGLLIYGEGFAMELDGVVSIILGAAGAMILRLTWNKRKRSAVKKMRPR